MSYEEQRLANIKANANLLRSLGLADPPPLVGSKKKAAPRKPKAPSAKEKHVKAEAAYTGGSDSSSEDEASGSDSDALDSSRKPHRRGKGKAKHLPASQGTRRSGRVSRKPAQFDPSAAASDGDTDDEYAGYRPSSSRRKEDHELQRKAQRLGIRTHNPKTFGHIPGVEVGTWWDSRMDCSTAAVHGPPVAGISGSAEKGAYSVALSGGYPDDKFWSNRSKLTSCVDLGEAFTYTGSGGRDLKGTKLAPKNLRTAPQTFDQSFDNNVNAALKKSAETRKPVRVIRGFKLDSVYAPREGYRYDGLYIVQRAWMAKGMTRGLLVCKYAFQRVAGQPPLPVRDFEAEAREEEESAAEEAAEEEPVAEEETNAVAPAEEQPAAQRTRTRSASTAPPAKRPRNRPVKLDSEAESAAAAETETETPPPTKRRRSRLSKTKLAAASPPAKRGRPTKSSGPSQVSSMPPPASPVPPVRRSARAASRVATPAPPSVAAAIARARPRVSLPARLQLVVEIPPPPPGFRRYSIAAF